MEENRNWEAKDRQQSTTNLQKDPKISQMETALGIAERVKQYETYGLCQ